MQTVADGAEHCYCQGDGYEGRYGAFKAREGDEYGEYEEQNYEDDDEQEVVSYGFHCDMGVLMLFIDGLS